MIKHTKVYRNQSTIIPLEIQKKTNFTTNDIIKWTINKDNKEIKINIIKLDNIKKELINKIIKTEDYVHIYRTISEKRHVILPVEVEHTLNFDFKENMLEWNIQKDKITISKTEKANILNISGIIKKL